ncbi:MAG: helix-turn-helix transcriptional regulator [Lachnospiraceae bacterium]|nr:helix-turn-helix transcriptional regulator [Lachnospiraceae bacterium]
MGKRREYDPEVVGQNLKRLREERGFTVEEIREYLCLGSVQAVYKYENGKSYPAADTLLALMELYDVKVQDLVESCGTDRFRQAVLLFSGQVKWRDRAERRYWSGIAENVFLVLR